MLGVSPDCKRYTYDSDDRQLLHNKKINKQ